MNIDFTKFEKSIGKRLKFECSHILEGKTIFTDVFYASLREVSEDFIIVEQYLIESDENFENDKIKSNKRKLLKNKFKLNNEIPLNG
ncbi:hypothetical protein SL053_002051 [Flavobacterium psychrophilum]|nr:hypothetical protein [Flavobacterium psychrophilum]